MKTFIKSLALALTLGVVTFSTSVASIATKPGVLIPGAKNRSESFATYQTAVYPSTNQAVINVMLVKENGGTIQIKFKNKEGQTLAEQVVGRGKDKVALKFRVDELPDGDYTVEVSNGRDVTSKQVKLSTRPETSPRAIAMN